ncbi:MAG: AsmA family protein [Hyphomicrobium sp.]
MRTGPPAGGGGGGGRQPARKRFGFLKGVLLGLVALLLVAGAGAAYFVLNAPADMVRDKIIAEVKANTGRDLKIAGPASFTIYPSIGVSMREVSLSAPPGMSGKPLITMDGLDVSVRILPLLKREVYVERIILDKPVFELYADKQGRKSWEFAARPDARPVKLAQAQIPAQATAPPSATDAPPGTLPTTGAPAQAAPGQSLASIQQLHFGNVRIDNGTVRYSDAVSGAVQEASAINMKVGLSDLRQPLNAKGDLNWKGQKVDVDLTLTSLKSIMEDKPARVALDIASAPASAQFNGSLTLRDGYDVEGTLSSKSPSVRALAKWLGSQLPRAKGYGPFEASGQLRATAKSISLTGANIALDGATAKGQVTVETQGERPYIRTTLTVDELDLNKYIGHGGGDAVAGPKVKSKPAAAPEGGKVNPAGEATSAQSIEDLLKDAAPAAPGPRVQGYTKREGWSTDPIDLSGLDAADADAKLSVGRLLYQDIKVGQSQLTVTLKNKVMKTNFDDIQLYGGHGRGFITLDGTSAKTASAGANLSFDGIDSLPFLTDAAGFDKLSGKAKLTLAVAGQGGNQNQLMNALNGKGDFTFADGAVNGLNVAGMIRGITQGKLSGLKTSPTEKTDFSELASTWTIVNGVASNQDLRLVSPLLRLTGAGNVMVGTQQVDYMMRPKLVSSLAGQGGAGTEQGLEVPVRVHGPWSNVEYTPDLKGILSDPNKAVDTIKEIGKQLKGKNAGDALKSILGGGQQQGPAPGAQQPSGTGTTAPQAQPKPSAKQLLDQFLKQP